MTNSDALFARIAAVGLLVTVVIQILVIVLHTPGAEHANPNALFKWRIEVVAYLAIALFGGALVRSHPLTGTGLAAGGVFNIIQLGIGLSAFRPLLDGGEHLAPVFDALWRTAFFLYFTGKAAFGVAGLAYGTHLWRTRSGASRGFGGIVAALGAAGLITAIAAMVTGVQLLMLAGAVGVAAATLLALALIFAPPRAA
ncbi:MAG: hypothetical protein P8J20_12315 [Novosphingobium sp.]|nr:hypothetical protein [Novosphingobium sp.]